MEASLTGELEMRSSRGWTGGIRRRELAGTSEPNPLGLTASGTTRNEKVRLLAACPTPSPIFQGLLLEYWGLCTAEKMITSRYQGARGKVITMPVRNNSTYLSSEDVAHLLGFSVRTVTLWFNQWHETGGQEGIPGFKVGKSWRAERREIEAWIEKQKGRSVQTITVPLRQAR